MNTAHKHNAEQQKPDIKDYIAYIFYGVHTMFPITYSFKNRKNLMAGIINLE